MTTISPISMPGLMRQVTLHVRISGQRQFAVRIWLGTKLLRLAAWVIGCGIEIGNEPFREPVSVDENGIPSRLSVDGSGYDPSLGQRLAIYLDGVRQERVVSYDKDRGEISAWVGSTLATKKGVVTVRITDEAL